MKKLATLVSLMCFSISTIFGQVDSGNTVSYLLDEDNINEIMAHLLCEYEFELEGEEIIDFLTQLLSNGDGCGEILAYHSASSYSAESFTWDKVPGASTYRVASLGLDDGKKNRGSTKNPKYQFEPLTIQPYIFAFMADCAGTVGIASIIIVDKDVGYQSEAHSPLYNCECQERESTIELDASCPDLNSYFFPWSNSCDLNKYKYSIEGYIGEELYSTVFWTIYSESSFEGYNGNLLLMEDCDPNYIENEYSGGPGAIGDPGKFMVNFSTTGTHIYITNQLLNISSVEAAICGCADFEEMGQELFRLDPEKKESMVFPNPFESQLIVNLPVEFETATSLTVLDQMGKAIFHEEVDDQSSNQTLTIDTQSFLPGIYYLKMERGIETTIEKIIKL